MIWLIFTLVSTSIVKDVDHVHFVNYNECVQYVKQLHSSKPKSCFTSYAKFKQPKKVKQ